MNEHRDVIVIGSGIGGGATALRLARNGVKVLLLERGDWIAQEPDNWEVPAVFFDKKYTADDRWYDGTGTIFRPNIYYNVGGATKFYGAAMIRLRERDFDELSHEEGVSPAWPISYAEIEPYYVQAEELFKVHGDDSGDITAPRRSAPYPFPKIAHEPIVQTMADALLRAGVPTSALPLGIDYAPSGACILCKTCDGFPCQLHAKSEAETALVRPALATQNVTLWRNALVQRLILSPDGRTVAAVEVEHEGETKQVSAKIIVVACGAVNSAALLLRSASEAAPGGVANRSDAVGRYYMAHNQTALMGLAWQRNDTVFQKTLMMNQFYFGAPGERYPLGHVQMLGKLQGGMLSANVPFLPKAVGRTMARHSMDLIAFSEDLPDPDNRVRLKNGMIHLDVRRNNLGPHTRLIDRLTRLMRRAGYPIVLTKALVKHSTAHQCGTVRFGDDPGTSALDPFCRSHDHANLFVVDASFMPSSAAVNPALTIAAQALRAADHMLARDFGVRVSASSMSTPRQTGALPEYPARRR